MAKDYKNGVKTKEELLKRAKEIKQYQSCYSFIKDEQGEYGSVDNFNEKDFENEKCVNFVLRLSKLFEECDVKIEGFNGWWGVFKVDGKQIGTSALGWFLDNEKDWAKTLELAIKNHKEDEVKNESYNRLSDTSIKEIDRINKIINHK